MKKSIIISVLTLFTFLSLISLTSAHTNSYYDHWESYGNGEGYYYRSPNSAEMNSLSFYKEKTEEKSYQYDKYGRLINQYKKTTENRQNQNQPVYAEPYQVYRQNYNTYTTSNKIKVYEEPVYPSNFRYKKIYIYPDSASLDSYYSDYYYRPITLDSSWDAPRNSDWFRESYNWRY